MARALIVIIFVWTQTAAAQDRKEAMGPVAFQLASVEFGVNLVSPEFRLEHQSDFRFAQDGLRYKFLGELASPVLEATKLRLDRVVLADGTKLNEDQIRLAGRTYRGQTVFQTDDYGIHLAQDHRTLMIDVEIDQKGVVGLREVAGSFDVGYGDDDAMLTTGLLDDQEGSHEDTVGARVDKTMKWGSARYLAVIAPIDAASVKALAVLGENGKAFPLVKGMSTKAVPRPDGSALIKLYVEKPEGARFAVEITRALNMQTASVPFRITDIAIGDALASP